MRLQIVVKANWNVQSSYLVPLSREMGVKEGKFYPKLTNDG